MRRVRGGRGKVVSYKYHPNHINSLALAYELSVQSLIDDKWQPRRPVSCPTLLERFRLAWWVMTGKADALTWPGQ